MPEEKNNTPAETGKDFNRRDFFVKLGLGSLSIAAAGTAAFSYQFLSPNVLYEPSPIVNAGRPGPNDVRGSMAKSKLSTIEGNSGVLGCSEWTHRSVLV